jgi:hypothetical protein
VLARLQTLAQELPSMSNVEKIEAGKSVAEDGDIQQMVAEGLFTLGHITNGTLLVLGMKNVLGLSLVAPYG